MKTLHIGMGWLPEQPGGLSRYYYELSQAAEPHFDMRGIVAGSTRVSTDSDGKAIAFASPTAPLAIRLLRANTTFKALNKGYAPDLVVSHFALNTMPLLHAIDRPLVLQFHGPWAKEGNYEHQSQLHIVAKAFIERTVYRRASRAIALSHAFADQLAEQFGFDRSHIDVIPGGVNIARFAISIDRQTARRTLGWDKDRPTIVTVRRLVPRMGLDRLIEAIALLKWRGVDCALKIVGEGPLAKTLEAQIQHFGLEDRVALIGHVSDYQLPLFYRAADASIVPSQSLEGFGLIVLESLAAGTPALVSPIGGLPETVAQLDHRLILQSPSARDIAEGIESVFAQSGLPGADECLAYARQFDWSIIAAKLVTAYAKAI